MIKLRQIAANEIIQEIVTKHATSIVYKRMSNNNNKMETPFI